ncbi:phosphoglycolate phosphatase [Eoetvoesiella caeni]|uniref:Phosphoglycolate phosphatase n=1 Tax=Eoetvoesiella caeni TaxID=645616 RepID=A0A366H2P5_9BURK|nr:phosphoglycolate phosphatase [Eoetvoesiella caeni]MCI2810582.1 phosphoglycolate phosphatase [Eoetvoesiella caeni]NYT56633.1 phosphoglycolate phosphatase [Eoetvoesiella caeni]RBP36203.1 phosphoglycolate phosphatase [Eoetvoesiella caeni]
MTFSAVLLDLDGTLLNTVPDLTLAVNAMRADINLAPLPLETIATYVGKGVRQLIVRSLQGDGIEPDHDLVERCRDLFNRHYHPVNGLHATLYPGVIEGLDAFRRLGLKLAVVTNKPTEFTLPLLERTGLAPYFEQVVCGDTCARHKPDPMPLLHACGLLQVPPAQTVMVGDSINDAQAARAAGMAVLAVPYGYNEGLDVQNLKVDDIVMSIDAAAQWISARGTSPVPA